NVDGCTGQGDAFAAFAADLYPVDLIAHFLSQPNSQTFSHVQTALGGGIIFDAFLFRVDLFGNLVDGAGQLDQLLAQRVADRVRRTDPARAAPVLRVPKEDVREEPLGGASRHLHQVNCPVIPAAAQQPALSAVVE